MDRRAWQATVPWGHKELDTTERLTQQQRALCHPWTVARQALLSMGFSRQEFWSEWPSPSSGDLPDPGIKPRSPALQVDSLMTEPPG